MEIPAKRFYQLVLATLAAGCGVLLFHLVPYASTARNAVLFVEAVVGLAFVTWYWQKGARQTSGFSQSSGPKVVNRPALLVVYAGFAILWSLLYFQRWAGLEPYSDDHHYLAMSADWQATKSNLFRPHNEHLVVPQRLFDFVVVAVGRHVGIAHATQLGSTLLFVAAVALLHLVAVREFDSPLAGPVCVLLFAFSTVYSEVLTWFTASLWLIPLMLFLTGILCVQCRGIAGAIGAACVAFCSCFSFSIGLIVGPLLCVWQASKVESLRTLRSWLLITLPAVGTAAAMAIVVPFMLRWFQTAEYLGSSSREALREFDIVAGTGNIVRVMTDFLLLRNLGIYFCLETWWLYALLFPLLPAGLVLLARRHPESWQLFPMLTVILAPYLMVYPFRSFVPYAILQMWTRYHLFPQMGLAMLLTGSLTMLRRSSFDQPKQPTWRQTLVLISTAGLLTTWNLLSADYVDFRR